MRALGMVLIAAGLATAVRSALLLAGRGRPRRGPAPAFVLAGPYRRMRNPIFGGVVVALAGAAIATASARLGLVAAAALAASHAWVVGVEEPRRSARFGAAYRAYLRRVPRWWPARIGADRADVDDL